MQNNEDSLYLYNNPNRMQSISYQAILLGRIGAEFIIYQNMVAGTEITDGFYVVNWFQIQKIKSPMMKRLSYIIHSVTPSQT